MQSTERVTGRSTVVAVFDERDDAKDAIDGLKDAGFRGDDIGLVARNQDEAGAVSHETGTKAGQGAATGAVAGGLLGGLGGFLTGLGALAIPVVGPVIAAGAFATALVGAAAGAGIGAIAGALVGMGIPEEEAKWYDERVRAGGWLVSVNAQGRYDDARSILRDYGGKDYEAGTSATAHRSWDEASPDFRSRYETRYGAGQHEASEPAHRFGYEAHGRSHEQGTGGGWRSAEPELRREWESRGEGSWEEHRSHIRHGYDYGRGRGRFRDYDDEDSAVSGGGAGAAGGTAIGDADEDRESRRRL